VTSLMSGTIGTGAADAQCDDGGGTFSSLMDCSTAVSRACPEPKSVGRPASTWMQPPRVTLDSTKPPQPVGCPSPASLAIEGAGTIPPSTSPEAAANHMCGAPLPPPPWLQPQPLCGCRHFSQTCARPWGQAPWEQPLRSRFHAKQISLPSLVVKYVFPRLFRGWAPLLLPLACRPSSAASPAGAARQPPPATASA